jgi:hypothetical protein
MAPTLTSRIQLSKPDPNDFVNVLVDLDGNYDKIDLLAKRPDQVPAAPVKRNNADAVTSGTDLLFETWTGTLKTNHWYEVQFSCQYNTSLAINTTPNGNINIRMKAGGSVTVSDTRIATGTPPNINNSSPRFTIGHTFDVPSDGAYTLGVTANSGGGTNTLNIIASGGTDNTGISRVFWVKDLGEK